MSKSTIDISKSYTNIDKSLYFPISVNHLLVHDISEIQIIDIGNSIYQYLYFKMIFQYQ